MIPNDGLGFGRSPSRNLPWHQVASTRTSQLRTAQPWRGKLQPLMVALLEKVQVSEGLLPENAVLDDGNPGRLNAFRERQAQLAQACRAWGMAGKSTSRADAWRTYAAMVADKVQEVAPEAVSIVDVYRPSFILSQPNRNSTD